MSKVAGSGYESGSISQRHGSPNPDPYPYQNWMDPQHCLVLMDSDRGGPKTYRYGSGSWSATPGIKLNILPILLTKMPLLWKPYVSAWRLYFAGWWILNFLPCICKESKRETGLGRAPVPGTTVHHSPEISLFLTFFTYRTFSILILFCKIWGVLFSPVYIWLSLLFRPTWDQSLKVRWRNWCRKKRNFSASHR